MPQLLLRSDPRAEETAVRHGPPQEPIAFHAVVIGAQVVMALLAAISVALLIYVGAQLP